MSDRLRADAPAPRWLRYVLICDRSGSSWFIGTSFLFGPVLLAVSPWHVLSVAVMVAISVAGLWLGLLGIAMAAGLAQVLRNDQEIPERYWRTIVDYPDP